MDTEDLDLSEEEEEITAETVLKTLQTAWQNERLAPEILPHRNDMVECMLGQIQHMERNINKLPKTDLRACIHKMELNRIKYIICNYLKTRLNKIEKFCISIVNDERQRTESGTNYLTPSELVYAQKYLENMENHLKNTVLNQVPGRMQTFELNKMAIYPNMQSHVFLKANDTINGIVLEDVIGDQDEEIDIEVEVGARGIPAKSLYNLIKDLGLTRNAATSILERASKAALVGSYQIWMGRERDASSEGWLPAYIAVQTNCRLGKKW